MPQSSSPFPSIRARADARPITDTKVVPPRAAQRLIPREGLMSRLVDARRLRCVTIQGPAGFGKTSTLLAWRRELLGMNFDVAWFSLAPEDNDLERFSNCVLASLAEVEPGLGAGATVLLDRDSDEIAIEHWVIMLIQTIAQRPRELVLMFDDAHHIEDPRLFLLLQWLLEYAPVHLHVVLAARSVVPLPLAFARLRAQGQLAEFDLSDLRFSAAESERLLREYLGNIDKRDAAVLHELTDGWAAGLQLFAVDLKAKQMVGYNRVQVRDASTFASYFEREVLVRLPPVDLRLLTCASVCDRFSAALCATLLGQPQAVPRVLTRLVRLDGEGLFISQIKSQDRETWYRLHPLLREVLRARLAMLPDAERRALHATARGWFAAQGYVDEAVRQAVLADDPEAAADIVEASAGELLSKGDLSQLSGLLRRLPERQMEDRPGLRLVMAHLQLYSRNYVGCRQSVARLMSSLDRLDENQRHALTVLRGSYAMHRDDTDTMEALVPELQAIPGNASDFVLSGRSNVLAWLHMYKGEYEQARILLDANAHLSGSPRRGLLGRCMNGLSQAIEGRITQVEHVLREVMQEAEGQGPGYLVISTMAAAMLATALYEQGDHEGVCMLLERRMKILERVALPDTALQATLILALANWLEGRRAEAQSWAERLEQHAERDGLDRLLVYALFVRMRFALATGRVALADEMLVRIEAVADKHVPPHRGTSQEISVMRSRAHIERLLWGEEYAEVVERARALIDLSSVEGRYRRVAMLQLQLGIALRGLNRIKEGNDQIVEALRTGHRLSLLRSLLDTAPQVTEVLGVLQSEGALDPVLGFYVQRLLAVSGSGVAEKVRTDETEPRPLSHRELEILELVAQALPNKKIARVLNVSPETVKWHLKNVFLKLGVAGRDEAIAKLRDQGVALPGVKL